MAGVSVWRRPLPDRVGFGSRSWGCLCETRDCRRSARFPPRFYFAMCAWPRLSLRCTQVAASGLETRQTSGLTWLHLWEGRGWGVSEPGRQQASDNACVLLPTEEDPEAYYFQSKAFVMPSNRGLKKVETSRKEPALLADTLLSSESSPSCGNAPTANPGRRSLVASVNTTPCAIFCYLCWLKTWQRSRKFGS